MEVKRGSLAELWRYRELLWFLAWRDITVRYKQTVFGAAWAIVQPLLGMLVFTAFFRKLLGPGDGEVPYPVFTYCALVPWTYFSNTLSLAGNSLVSNSGLITKVYFPRVLLPASSALSGLLDFLVGSAFLIVLMGYYRIQPTWTLIVFPLLMIALWIFTLGVSMWLAALNVRYRDVKHVIPFLVQLGLFVTPVMYPSTMMPHQAQRLLMLNPMAGLIEGFRACLFPLHPVDMALIAGSAAVGAVLVAGGGLYFRNADRAFADIV